MQQALMVRASLDRRRSLGAPFRAVWLSVAISGTGDGMFLTAFPLLATAMTRDAVLIAGVTVASRLHGCCSHWSPAPSPTGSTAGG